MCAAFRRFTVLLAPLTTAWMQEVEQRREQLPRRSPDKPPALPGGI
jgi:hypothetical protein